MNDKAAADHARELTAAAMSLTDKLLDDLNDRSGFSLDADVRGILRSDWIVLIAKYLVERDDARDEMARALTEALDLFDAHWCTAHGHSPLPEAFDRATRLKKLVQPTFSRETYP